jgi:hypothetical protein
MARCLFSIHQVFHGTRRKCTMSREKVREEEGLNKNSETSLSLTTFPSS